MAKQLVIDAGFIMALSVHESEWNGSHAQELHNLFGLTNAGGNNLSFETYQESADYWIKHYRSAVQGAETIKEFTDALLKIGYNSVDDDWQTKIVGGALTVGKDAGKTTIGTYKSVINALKQCDK
jgi:hypothetical protein